jgi:hypothetical protein
LTRFIPGRWNAVCRLIGWLACLLATVHCRFQVGVPAPLTADSLSIDPIGLPPRTLIESPPQRPVPKWLQTHLRIGHLPGYDERMVKEFLKAGYNVVTVNCLERWDRVGPSAVMYSADEVKRADEYLHRVVDTIHAAGAKSLLYIGPVQVPLFSKRFRAAHPEWLRVKPDGSRDENFGNIRSAYADWLCAQLAYVVREYHADGFWCDGYAPGHLHTYDETTERQFRNISGNKEIPTKFDPVRDPVARQYLAWHDQYFVDLADRMRGAIRAENPDAVLFANYSANRTWYYPEMYMGEYPAAYCKAVDVSSVELYWDVPGDALYQQFCCAFVQGVSDNRGGSVWIQPSEHGVSGVSSPVEIQLRGLEGAPWGIYPEFVEAAGREEYFKQHVANVKSREEWWEESEPVPYIGIVASEQTRTLYAQGALPVYFSHALGAFRAIFEKHWPVRILTEYDLEDADLHGVRVLMLPNVACLSPRAAEVVRRFVRQGGGLVASFETSLYDDKFARRSDFALADVLHAHYRATHPVQLRSDNIYLTIDADHPIVNDPLIHSKQATAWLGGLGPPPEKGNLALIASAVEATPTDGGKVLMTYNVNQPDVQNVRHPALIVSNFGKGRVVYFPAGVDKAMFFYPDTYIRELLANACRWAAAEAPPPVEVEGPLLLSATFRRQPQKGRIVVHLLNDHSSYGRHSIYQKLAPLPKELQKSWGFPNQSELRGTWPIREEVIPLCDIKVRCRVAGITKATLQPENRPLPLIRTNGTVEVVVPKLNMHSMVIFE